MSDKPVERKFCVFRVFDNKGGELKTEINISQDKLVEIMVDCFENVGKATSIKEITEDLRQIVNKKDFYTSYASCDGFCGEFYEIKNNKLVEVHIKSFIKPIAALIAKKQK